MHHLQAKNLIKQQIADDKRARQSKGKIIISPSSDRPQLSGEGREREARGEEREGEVKKKSPCSSSTCRLQVYTNVLMYHTLNTDNTHTYIICLENLTCSNSTLCVCVCV